MTTTSRVWGRQHAARLLCLRQVSSAAKRLQPDYNLGLLLETTQGRRLKLGDTHPHTLESWHSLSRLYEAWDKPEEAEKWRAKLPQTEAEEK